MNTTPMDNAALKHMDEIKSATTWALGLAFTATILALQDGDKLRVLDAELSRPVAFFALGLIYNSICAAITIHLLRISNHLKSIPAVELDARFKTLLSHEWLLNPFVSYDALGPRLRGFWGFSILIAIYWFGLSGLTLVYLKGPIFFWYLHTHPAAIPTANWIDIVESFAGLLGFLIPLALFIMIGYGAMTVILDIPANIAERLESLTPERATYFREIATELKDAANAGIALGGFVYIAVVGAASLLRW